MFSGSVDVMPVTGSGAKKAPKGVLFWSVKLRETAAGDRLATHEQLVALLPT